MFLFPSVAHVFRIAQKLQNPNLQCQSSMSTETIARVKKFLRNFSITLFERSMFTFIIIKPITYILIDKDLFQNHMVRGPL